MSDWGTIFAALGSTAATLLVLYVILTRRAFDRSDPDHSDGRDDGPR